VWKGNRKVSFLSACHELLLHRSEEVTLPTPNSPTVVSTDRSQLLKERIDARYDRQAVKLRSVWYELEALSTE
jgi:hypothetical protein